MTFALVPRFFRKAETVAIHPLQDGLAVGLPNTGQVFVFNPSARAIWEACEGGLSLPDLFERLTEQHPITETILFGEVLPFLERLKTGGLLVEEVAHA